MEVCPDVREKELVDKVTFLQNKVESLNEELSHLKKKLLCSHFQYQFHANDVFSTSVETVVEQNKTMFSLLNNIPFSCFVKDPANNFKYIYCNEAFSVLAKVKVNDIIGKNDYEIFIGKTDIDRFREDDYYVLQHNLLEYQEECKMPDGSIKLIKTLKKTIPSGTGSVLIMGMSWDVTDAYKTQKELEEARRKALVADKLKNSFLANMNHEIRTPLNAIVGFSKLIADASEKSDRDEYARIIEFNSGLLLSMFDEVLDLSALESGTLTLQCQAVKLSDLCRHLFEKYVLMTNSGVKLVLDNVDESLIVMNDWSRISQVLASLLNNAVKFTSAGSIHFGFTTHHNIIKFYVKDTGIGIPTHLVATIFKSFGKVDPFIQGSGLGLTLCRLLVEKMGGQIWVRSKENEGSIFYFTLPVTE